MFAAIDLGSNSFRLHIGRYENGAIHVLKSSREPNRLASGIDKNGYLSDEAINKGLEALSCLRAILNDYPLKAVKAVATDTLRLAQNASDFLQLAERTLGYPIEVISGEEEGRLIYLGVSKVLSNPSKRQLVIDVGGGSTEMILGRGENIECVESFSIGTVKQNLHYFREGILTRASFEEAILSARSFFEDAASNYHSQNFTFAYGSSGTIRAIAEILARNGFGNGDLTLPNLILLRESMVQSGRIDKLEYAGMKQERASSIVSGVSILVALFEQLELKSIKPVVAGLRMGVMWDLYFQSKEQDRRERSVRGFLQRFHTDETRAARVADDALKLFTAMKVTDDNVKYLYWSALLHELGLVISPTNYHKHGAYLVENADLAGFTAHEQRKMSKLILGQKGNLRKLNGVLDNPEDIKAVLALRLAVLFMRAKAEVDLNKVNLKVKNRIEIMYKKRWLLKHPTLAYLLDRERDSWEEIGIPFIIRSSPRN